MTRIFVYMGPAQSLVQTRNLFFLLELNELLQSVSGTVNTIIVSGENESDWESSLLKIYEPLEMLSCHCVCVTIYHLEIGNIFLWEILPRISSYRKKLMILKI